MTRAAFRGQGGFQRTGQPPEGRVASRGQSSFQRTGQLLEDRTAFRGLGSFQRTGHLPEDSTVSVSTVSSLVTEGGPREQTQSPAILVVCSAEKIHKSLALK